MNVTFATGATHLAFFKGSMRLTLRAAVAREPKTDGWWKICIMLSMT